MKPKPPPTNQTPKTVPLAEHPPNPQKMKSKLTILIFGLCLCFCIAPISAAEADEYNSELHPYGYTLDDIRANVAEFINDMSFSSSEKLALQTEAFGFDARLDAWLNAERDEETGEIQYDTYIPVITPIMQIFGWGQTAIRNPYTEEEGAAVWNQYLKTYITEYKPSGDFGGPIV
jgi:hypothetical protein